ncbi:MAG: hypothetical protein F6K39_35630 [Okeania sp. SIO3B3]|nr:hypothetical protein [Okeania sp. SIO3B3]
MTSNKSQYINMNNQIFVLDLHQESESCFTQGKLQEAQIICNKIIEIQ